MLLIQVGRTFTVNPSEALEMFFFFFFGISVILERARHTFLLIAMQRLERI
jgi:hypothetical protein